MVVYEEIYLEVCNYILYQGKQSYVWFSSTTQNGSDTHRFSNKVGLNDMYFLQSVNNGSVVIEFPISLLHLISIYFQTWSIPGTLLLGFVMNESLNPVNSAKLIWKNPAAIHEWQLKWRDFGIPSPCRNIRKCDKPVNYASHYGQWGHFFLACGQTNSMENLWIPWIQSSLDLFPK